MRRRIECHTRRQCARQPDDREYSSSIDIACVGKRVDGNSRARLDRIARDHACNYWRIVGAGYSIADRRRCRQKTVRNAVADADNLGRAGCKLLIGSVGRIEHEAVARGVIGHACWQHGWHTNDQQHRARIGVAGVGQGIHPNNGAVFRCGRGNRAGHHRR